MKLRYVVGNDQLLRKVYKGREVMAGTLFLGQETQLDVFKQPASSPR